MKFFTKSGFYTRLEQLFSNQKPNPQPCNPWERRGSLTPLSTPLIPPTTGEEKGRELIQESAWGRGSSASTESMF